jgi:hypothetical protein
VAALAEDRQLAFGVDFENSPEPQFREIQIALAIDGRTFGEGRYLSGAFNGLGGRTIRDREEQPSEK